MHPSIGIIGAGTIVDNYYIPALKHLGFSSITLADTNTTVVQQTAGKHRIRWSTTDQLLQQCDNIIIATPPHSHYDLLKLSLEAGKQTVICEKPFLFSKTEALQIMQMAHETQTNVMVAHIRRCFTVVNHAAHMLPSLSLGHLKKVTLFEGGRFSYKPKSDYVTHNPFGGVLLDTGSHVLDCLLYITGWFRQELKCTVLEVTKNKEEPSHEVKYHFLLNDTDITLHLSRFTPLANKMVLYYENGTVEIPLELKPNWIVTTQGKRHVYHSETCVQYMSEAFKQELNEMLVHNNIDKFGIAGFVELSGLLETLYYA